MTKRITLEALYGPTYKRRPSSALFETEAKPTPIQESHAYSVIARLELLASPAIVDKVQEIGPHDFTPQEWESLSFLESK